MNIFNRKTDYINIFNKAILWQEKYSINNNGIATTSHKSKSIYPEVTGYYIPTLLSWGKKEEAINFANYLTSIQNMDGSWNAPDSTTAYTFDTGQILKGLISLVDERLEYKNSIIKGCNWILTQQRNDGSIATPDYSAWNLPDDKHVPEAIHLYALEPLKKAGIKWNISKYNECVKKALDFYLGQQNLTDFDTLSHFHAYIIEGLIDLGQIERAKSAMENVTKYQKRNGSIPAYSDVNFVCSTGLFQYATCWYKLNNLEKGNKTFEYTCKLQNKTGGWYGSYGWKANYFPNEEISWAVKYFLDALYHKIHCEFNAMSHIFPTYIDENDGRYILIENELRKNKHKTVIDIGCGKGRFISKLKERNPNIKSYGIDISEEILKNVNSNTETKQGSLLNIPYPDNSFDLSYCIEALEHAVYIEGAMREMARITKPGGTLIIIDKNIKKLGNMKLSEWECWFDIKELTKIITEKGLTVSTHENLPYEGGKADNLFVGWIGKKQ
jgi:malonyl-CoA O-methyltransferase